MKETILTLLETERKAQQIIGKSQFDKNELNADIEKKISKIKADIENKAEKKCAAIMEFETDLTNSVLHEIEENKQKTLNKLEAMYKENADKWVSSVFDEIIN